MKKRGEDKFYVLAGATRSTQHTQHATRNTKSKVPSPGPGNPQLQLQTQTIRRHRKSRRSGWTRPAETHKDLRLDAFDARVNNDSSAFVPSCILAWPFSHPIIQPHPAIHASTHPRIHASSHHPIMAAPSRSPESPPIHQSSKSLCRSLPLRQVGQQQGRCCSGFTTPLPLLLGPKLALSAKRLLRSFFDPLQSLPLLNLPLRQAHLIYGVHVGFRRDTDQRFQIANYLHDNADGNLKHVQLFNGQHSSLSLVT